MSEIKPDFGWAVAVRDAMTGNMRLLAFTVRRTRLEAQLAVIGDGHGSARLVSQRMAYWRKERRRGHWRCLRVRVSPFGELHESEATHG